MNKKLLVVVGVLAVSSCVCYYVCKNLDVFNSSKHEEVNKVCASSMHSAILDLIVNTNQGVKGISVKEAVDELNERAKIQFYAEKHVHIASELQNDILILIARSGLREVAGISPSTAKHELIDRYVNMKVSSADDLTFSDLLFVFNKWNEEKNLKDWNKREDAEELDKFIKEEADKSSTSKESFLYGLRHIKEKPVAETYIKKFFENINGDGLDEEDKLNVNQLRNVLSELN